MVIGGRNFKEVKEPSTTEDLGSSRGTITGRLSSNKSNMEEVLREKKIKRIRSTNEKLPVL